MPFGAPGGSESRFCSKSSPGSFAAAAESANRFATHLEEITAKAEETAREFPAMVKQVDGRTREIQGILGDVNRCAAKTKLQRNAADGPFTKPSRLMIS
jgi:hypothetical protein